MSATPSFAADYLGRLDLDTEVEVHLTSGATVRGEVTDQESDYTEVLNLVHARSQTVHGLTFQTTAIPYAHIVAVTRFHKSPNASRIPATPSTEHAFGEPRGASLPGFVRP